MKLFKVSLEFETFKLAETPEEAIKNFWEGVEEGEGVTKFIDNCVVSEEIDVVEDYLNGEVE